MTGESEFLSEYYWSDFDKFLSIGISPHKRGYVAIGIIDISPRKKAEVRLRNLSRSLPDTVLYQTGGGIEYISDNVVNVLGYTNRELTSERSTFPSLIHLQDRERLKKEQHEWLNSGAIEPLEMEYRVKHNDGHYIWMLDRMSVAFRTPDGRHSYYGVMLDITDRKKNDERLSEQKRELEAIFLAFPDSYFRMDNNGIIIDCRSGSNSELFNAANGIVGNDLHQVFPEDVANEFISTLERVLRFKRMESFEFVISHDNSESIYEARLIAFYEDQVFVIVRDITSRVEQERMTLRHFNRLTAINQIAAKLNKLTSLSEIIDSVLEQLAIETGSDAVFFVVGDAEDLLIVRTWSLILDINTFAGQTVLVDQSRFFADAIRDNKPAVLTDAVSDEFTDLLNIDFTIKSSLVLPLTYHQTSSGYLVICSGEKDKYQNEDTSLLEPFARLLASALDRAENVEALERSESFLNSLFDQSPVSTWISDSSGTVIRLNKASRVLFGIDHDEQIAGKYNLFNDEVLIKQDAISGIKSVFTEGVEVQAVIDYSFADVGCVEVPEAIRRLIRLTAFPIKDSEGQVTNVIVQHHDMTTERELHNQLHHAQKMESIGTMAGGIAHDFNNFLTGILGYTTMLLMRYDPEHSDYKYFLQIEKATQQAAAVVRKMLALSRLDLPEPCIIDLREQLYQVVDLLHHSIPATISMSKKTPDKPMIAYADPARLEQVLLNICLNAKDAMPNGGSIALTSETVTVNKRKTVLHELPEGLYHMIKISDTGCGIPKSKLSRIFDPFFTTKPSGSGTGLGLAVAYGIIKAHKGWIDVNSVEGKGTAFSIYLPVSEGEIVQKKQNEHERVIGGKETILVADDEPTVLETSEQMLMSLGYEVFTAVDGPDTIKKVQKLGHKIDLLILDLTMPKMTGAEVFRAVKALKPSLKVLLMSGYNYGKKIQEMYDLGVDGFLPKPFRTSELDSQLRQILG